MTRIVRSIKVPAARVPADMSVGDVMVPGWNGNPATRLRFYRPIGLGSTMPALLWMHGGGFIMGNVEQDDRRSMAVARELGITVAAVSYRLAPEHPAPAALNDAYACLSYLHQRAAECRIDPQRIAIGGTSAGGGLTAALAQLAHDVGEITPIFQLMAYPMLDDRSASRTDRDHSPARLYTPKGHVQTWRWYWAMSPGNRALSTTPHRAAAAI